MYKVLGILFGLCGVLTLPPHSLSADRPASPVPEQQIESTCSWSSFKFVQATSGDEFDRGGCEAECMENFYGQGTNWWLPYATCVQDCNSKFWKDYDKRMQKLKDSNPN